jgi:hypothetical protein
LEALTRNGTFGEIQYLPQGSKTVKCKWVFKTKRDTDVNIIKHKARLVAKGYTQRDAVDYDETFSPVISTVGMLILISISASLGLKLRKYDVSNAYLYSRLDKEIFIEIPEGYECDSTNGKGLLLKKDLNGLNQSGALWNKLLTRVLMKYGYKRNDYEPSIFYKNENNSFSICAIYVDDIILGTRHDKDIIEFELTLESNFKITKGPVDEI